MVMVLLQDIEPNTPELQSVEITPDAYFEIKSVKSKAKIKREYDVLVNELLVGPKYNCVTGFLAVFT